MFRKSESAASSGKTLLTKSASKAFQKQVAKAFGIGEDALGRLFGKHQLVLERLPGRCFAYCIKEEEKQHVPLFLDLNGHGDLCPTVLALWRCPELLPCVWVPSAVSSYLLNGADLMLPGILNTTESLGRFAAGSRAAVYVAGNPAALGVGAWALSSRDMADAPSPGDMKGKGLAMIHTYRDALWSFGGEGLPNEGFLRDVVRPLPRPPSSPTPSASASASAPPPAPASASAPASAATGSPQQPEEGEEEGGPAKEGVQGKSSKSSAAASPSLEGGEKKTAVSGGEGDITAGPEGSMEEAEKAEDDSDADESKGSEDEGCDAGVVSDDGDESDEVSPEEMDEWLERAFLVAAKTSLSSAPFPLDGSEVLSNHMLRLQCPVRLELRRSSYKQLATFLKAMAKKGLVTLKSIRGQNIVTAVSAQHPLVKAALPLPPLKRRKPASGPRDEKKGGGAGKGGVTVLTMYRPKQALRLALFPGEEPDKLYHTKDVRDALLKYVREAGLDKGGSIQLDPVLAGIFFSGPGKGAPEQVAKKDLTTMLSGHLDLYYALVPTGEDPARARFRKGPVPSVHVAVETRQGNKAVTLVTGLEPFNIPVERFASQAKKAFAASVTVTTVASKGKQIQQVAIQGAVHENVAKQLHSLYGIPLNHVDIQGPRKKRKG